MFRAQAEFHRMLVQVRRFIAASTRLRFTADKKSSRSVAFTALVLISRIEVWKGWTLRSQNWRVEYRSWEVSM